MQNPSTKDSQSPVTNEQRKAIARDFIDADSKGHKVLLDQMWADGVIGTSKSDIPQQHPFRGKSVKIGESYIGKDSELFTVVTSGSDSWLVSLFINSDGKIEDYEALKEV